MSLKPSVIQAALMEEVITARLDRPGLEEVERQELEAMQLDLRRYRTER